MLIDKGFDVGFTLASGKELDIAGDMLHDPDGESWPSCSLLFLKVKRGPPVEMPSDARWYFGRGYEAHQGSVELPRKALESWKPIGEVETIYYERPGLRAPGKFRHGFGKRRWQALFKKGKLPTLYRLDGAYRLELGRGCVATDLGIVFP